MNASENTRFALLSSILTIFVGMTQLEAASPNNDSMIRVAVEAPSGASRGRVYITLWKAVEPHDEVSVILQQNRLGLYDEVFWRERVENAIWIRCGNSPGSSNNKTEFTDLRPGKYRVTVNSFDSQSSRPDPTPFGVSSPVSLGAASVEEVKVSLSGSIPLVVRMVDADSKSPLERVNIRLRSSTGMPIVHGHGSGNFFERTDERGEIRYSQLIPGTYFVEVLGRDSTVFNLVEYRALPHDIAVEVRARETRVDIPLNALHLSQDEIERRYPFTVVGTVTAEDKVPLKDVCVRAHSGFATLLETGATTTDADGRYELRFMPGGSFGGHKWGAGGQSVQISANKEGASGVTTLRVSDQPLEGNSEVILPNMPYRLDITLHPTK